MTVDGIERLREKDLAVLRAIGEGNDNTREIREATTLSNRDVNYALDKLEDLGYLQTETPDGRVTQIIEGQKRDFRAPRKAELTSQGETALSEAQRENTPYQELSREELVETVQELDHRVSKLESAFDTFRQQVLDRIG